MVFSPFGLSGFFQLKSPSEGVGGVSSLDNRVDVVEGLAAPLPRDNIDTDLVIPKQYLTTITRVGLGRGLFHELRVDVAGKTIDQCLFNQEPYLSDARILVARRNFGCGSSREHAVWALKDYGFACVIAQSFADIFFGNCIKNFIIPATVTIDDNMEILKVVEDSPQSLKVDLTTFTISHGVKQWPFSLEAGAMRRLREGLDDISLTLQDINSITQFEKRYFAEHPWLAS